MAVPKRKMGRARTHARRSTNDKISMPARSVCPQCGEVSFPTACAVTAVTIATVRSSRRSSPQVLTVTEGSGAFRDVGKASSHSKLVEPGLPGGFLAIGRRASDRAHAARG